MSKQQAFNPYLPEGVYIPDGEPHVFGDRVYIYGSHDKYNGTRFCPGDYYVWSAPAADLKDWSVKGVAYPRRGKHNRLGWHCMWAPDCCRGADGLYYLYYCFDFNNALYVASSRSPDGPFSYVGQVKHADGTPYGKGRNDLMCFDPAVFRDDDGQVYLYSGFSPDETLRIMLRFKGIRNCDGRGGQVLRLAPDMLTVQGEPRMLIPGYKNSRGTGFEGHEMYEASSMRKIKGRYYFIYSSRLSHELAYAVSERPDSGFKYMGALISNGDIGYQGRSEKDAVDYWGNNHGSLLCLGDRYYIFYHRQTNRTEQSRQGCAEEIKIRPDGSFAMAEMTSCGLNGGPLKAEGSYPAYIACNLKGPKGAFKCGYGPFSFFKYRREPYIGQDRQGHECLRNLREGSTAGFKYFQSEQGCSFGLKARGSNGKIIVSVGQKDHIIGTIRLEKTKDWRNFSLEEKLPAGIFSLYLTFEGQGKCDIAEISF